MSAEDYFDVFGYDGDNEEVECKFCGKGGLSWEEDCGGWVLIDHKGGIHKCSPARLARTQAEDFDDIS